MLRTAKDRHKPKANEHRQPNSAQRPAIHKTTQAATSAQNLSGAAVLPPREAINKEKMKYLDCYHHLSGYLLNHLEVGPTPLLNQIQLFDKLGYYID